MDRETIPHEPVSVTVFVDDNPEPIGVYHPPAKFELDTTQFEDGDHVLRLHALDRLGNLGVRSIPFTVANGPGITVTGLRARSRVRGKLQLNVNAFGADEPFDPHRAESQATIPVWTWVLLGLFVAWTAWYGLEWFKLPAAFAKTPTYAADPALATVMAPDATPTPAAAAGAAGGAAAAAYDDAAGAKVYAANCQACHGADGGGTPGAFPPMKGDPVVNGDGDTQIKIVLHGLSGKTIGGTKYAAQMPAFASQLSDADIAAAIDHERTSWGNTGKLVTADDVKKDR